VAGPPAAAVSAATSSSAICIGPGRDSSRINRQSPAGAVTVHHPRSAIDSRPRSAIGYRLHPAPRPRTYGDVGAPIRKRLRSADPRGPIPVGATPLHSPAERSRMRSLPTESLHRACTRQPGRLGRLPGADRSDVVADDPGALYPSD